MTTFDTVFGVLAPHQCLACGVEGSLLCHSCLETAGEPIVPRCVGCHKLSDEFKTCSSCKDWLVVERVAVATVYEGVYEDLLFAMKFDSKRQAAKSVAYIMSESNLYLREGSILCPIPTAPSRIRQRGFDHTKLITNYISKELSIKNNRFLSRKTNKRQFGATRANRLKQMENEFFLTKNQNIIGKDIVLVDDVVTTGATLSSCAKTLKKAGAKSVSAVVFAQKI